MAFIHKLWFSPWLHGHTHIFNSPALFTAGLEGHSIFLFLHLCDWSTTHLAHQQKSWWMFWRQAQTHNATGKEACLYTMHTRRSCQSLEALCKGSSFEMVPTYPLTSYFLSFKFWKKKQVHHLCSESQLHTIYNIHTVKRRFKCYRHQYLFLCFYMIANARRVCPKAGSFPSQYFSVMLKKGRCSQKYCR